MTQKIILDCDPGHDDAVAILLAGNYPNIELLGITVAAGNQTIEKTTRNTLNIVQYLNIDVPVFQGAPRGLIKEQEVCAEIHGESGLDGFDFPSLIRQKENKHAVNYIIDTLLKSEDKITLVATGPLTNIALALKMEPQITKKIEKVVIMGGSMQMGNVSPAAELNILCDPEAAHIVLNSDLEVYMVTLDVTRKVLCYPSIVERMKDINNYASKLFVDLMIVFNENQKKIFGHDGGPLHDPVTIAYLIDNSLIEFKKVNVEIDLSHQSSYGRTNCDVFNYLKKPSNCFVSQTIDVEKFWNIVENGLKNYGDK